MFSNSRTSRFGLLLGLISVLLSACWIDTGAELATIAAPADLPDEWKGFRFYLFKRGEFGSKVIVADLDQKHRQLYHNPAYLARVDVSPDGRQLVYLALTSSGSIQPLWLYGVDLESGAEHKIAGWYQDHDRISISNPGFSQDGRQVLFTVTWYEQELIGLARVNWDGSNLEILTTDLGLTEGPEPSGDGSLIMVVCAGPDLLENRPGFQLCLLDREGKFLKYLTHQGIDHGSYSFTPDGKSIIYSEHGFGGVFGLYPPPQFRFLSQDLETGHITQLLNWEVSVLGYSAAGREIAFLGKESPRSPWRIYIMDLRATDLRHLTYFDDFLEAWYDDAAQ